MKSKKENRKPNGGYCRMGDREIGNVFEGADFISVFFSGFLFSPSFTEIELTHACSVA